ncbi:Chromosome partition protein Smc [Bremerella volcania]|uniref:Chromosome partition protein Smc n=1 Tax=Bremerella volcania TaxID=2527984 RepID=A0A518C3W2_9BACT|nr:FHA domain-containing protein [Bremerella volcania]QDU73903.1 Chromosome partition protein Smc [Bremerella volcania]
MVQNNVAPRSKHDSRLLGKSTSALVLKIEGTERDGQIIRVHAPKCLIGSSADCQLRLIAADVQPKHCVIYRGSSGMIVKSWTRDTRVNGDTISEAWLRIGDRLSLGSLSFEVLEDQQSETTAASPTPPNQSKSQRKLRKRSNRRIRSLLDVVRKQKDSFSELQAKFDKTQQMVDSLLTREADAGDAAQAVEAETAQVRAERRKRHNQRARLLLHHVRNLITSNNAIQEELREQLEIKQNQVNEIRRELTANADATEEERARHRRLEADLQESEALIAHLKEQTSELQSREERLRERWISARKIGKNRVKSILSHLRGVRKQLSQLDGQSNEEDELGASRLTKLRLAYDDASRELNESRDSLKDAESELAWTQQELEQRQQHSEDLSRKIAELEQQLVDGQNAQPSGMPPEEAAQYESQLKTLRSQLEDATLRGDDLKLQLEELRQQNLELHQTINQQKEIEENWKNQLEDARQQCLDIRRQLEDERRLADLQSSHEEPEPTEEEQSAMNHLRSMGILRDTPSPTMPEESSYDESEDEIPEQSPAEDEAPSANPMTGLTSFPDFQFPEEETPQEPETEWESHEPVADTPADEPKPSTGSDDDISIDDYMQSLLARMRAKTGEPEPPPKPKPTAAEPVVQSEPAKESEPVRPITREEFVPSRYAPEQTSDIRKLRELANETAKAAIDSATINRWESLCKSKLVVSMLALGTGFFLHYLSPSYLSISFAGACLAYVVTVFWWLQSAVIYQHVKNHRRERLEKRFNDEIINPHGLSHAVEHDEED